MYTLAQKKIILEEIKKELRKLPEYKMNGENKYPRVDLGDMLYEVFLDEEGKPNFSVHELRKLDLSNFGNQTYSSLKMYPSGVDFSYTNINGKALFASFIFEDSNDLLIENKLVDLTYANFEGVDLSGVTIENAIVTGVNLRKTGAKINPQSCFSKAEDQLLVGVSRANLEGLDLSEVDFDGVLIKFANLKGTGARINPQTVKDRSLYHVNLEGLDLSGKSFEGADIRGTKLRGTGAEIDPQTIRDKDLSSTDLEGLDLSGKVFDGVTFNHTNIKNTGAVIDFSTIEYGYNVSNVGYLEGCGVVLSGILNQRIDMQKDYTGKYFVGVRVIDDIAELKSQIGTMFEPYHEKEIIEEEKPIEVVEEKPVKKKRKFFR